MRFRVGLIAITSVALGASAKAQTIQLPSIHQFSVDTTVVVPDSGGAPVAGVKRAASGSNRFGGLPTQRAAGVERQAAGAIATAKIHDPQEADQAVLQQARRARLASAEPAARADLTFKPGDPGLQSVAEIERQRARQAATQEREAVALRDRARQARAEGKSSTAALYYRMASRQASGSLKREIDAELRQLKQAAAASSSSQAARTAK